MNWIGIITTLLTVVNILVCLLLIFIVLLQRPKTEGLGAAFGGDTASNIFGAQTTNVLATLTRWLGGIFLALCFVIAILGKYNRDTQSKVSDYIKTKAVERQAEDEKKKLDQSIEDAAKQKTDGKNPSGALEKQVGESLPVPALEPGKPAPAPGTPPAATPNKPAAAAPDPAKPASPAPTPTPGAESAKPATPIASKPAPAVDPAKTPEPAKPATPPAPEPAKPATPEPPKTPAPAEGAPKPPQ